MDVGARMISTGEFVKVKRQECWAYRRSGFFSIWEGDRRPQSIKERTNTRWRHKKTKKGCVYQTGRSTNLPTRSDKGKTEDMGLSNLDTEDMELWEDVVWRKYYRKSSECGIFLQLPLVTSHVSREVICRLKIIYGVAHMIIGGGQSCHSWKDA